MRISTHLWPSTSIHTTAVTTNSQSPLLLYDPLASPWLSSAGQWSTAPPAPCFLTMVENLLVSIRKRMLLLHSLFNNSGRQKKIIVDCYKIKANKIVLSWFSDQNYAEVFKSAESKTAIYQYLVNLSITHLFNYSEDKAEGFAQIGNK